jgi:hypothetical protein
MNIRRSLFHVTAGRGESSTRGVAPHKKSVRLKALALLGIAVLAVATVQSCRATHNDDGSVTFTFAPDMAITAWGLEDALRQLQDLYRACLAGSWQRACTPEETAALERMHARVLAEKERLNHD